MILKFAINILFGAVIGAFTNALAIHHIFRYILPRRKAEVAGSVREVVANELFSIDKIVARFDDAAVHDQISRNIGEWIDEICTRDLPSVNELCRNHLPDVEKFSRTLRHIVVEEVMSQLGSIRFRDDILRPFVAARWQELQSRSPAELLPQLEQEMSSAVIPMLDKTLSSPLFRARLSMTIGNILTEKFDTRKSLDEQLPHAVREAILDLIGSQSHFVVERLADAVEEPEFQQTIADTVCKAVHAHLAARGGIMGRIKQFGAQMLGIDSDIRDVCANLPQTIREHFLAPASQEHVRQALLKIGREFMRKDWRQMLNNPSPRQIRQLIYMGLNTSLDNRSAVNAFHELAADGIDKLLRRPLGEISGISAGGQTLDQATEALHRILSGTEMRRILGERVREFIDSAREMPLGRLQRFVSPEARQKMTELGVQEVRTIVIQRLHDFTEQTGLWNIISESIQSYDNRELESMIRRIANRELRWVTWLGGILGAIIGIIQTFITLIWNYG